MRTRVKICGLTREEDARDAAGLGADFLGLVFASSPRQTDVASARRWVGRVRAEYPALDWVGVFVAPSQSEIAEAVEALGLTHLQLHGLEPGQGFATPVPWIRALPADKISPLERSGDGSGERAEERSDGDPAGLVTDPWALLVDTPAPDRFGGTGETYDWKRLEAIPRSNRLFVAGGLDAENVGTLIRGVRPFAVDVSSRLEQSPGEKDREKVAAFFAAVTRADAQLRRQPEENR